MFVLIKILKFPKSVSITTSIFPFSPTVEHLSYATCVSWCMDHFRSFDGRVFHFHGDCEDGYLLAQDVPVSSESLLLNEPHMFAIRLILTECNFVQNCTKVTKLSIKSFLTLQNDLKKIYLGASNTVINLAYEYLSECLRFLRRILIMVFARKISCN